MYYNKKKLINSKSVAGEFAIGNTMQASHFIYKNQYLNNLTPYRKNKSVRYRYAHIFIHKNLQLYTYFVTMMSNFSDFQKNTS